MGVGRTPPLVAVISRRWVASCDLASAASGEPRVVWCDHLKLRLTEPERGIPPGGVARCTAQGVFSGSQYFPTPHGINCCLTASAVA